jgi:hypothetical protein
MPVLWFYPVLPSSMGADFTRVSCTSGGFPTKARLSLGVVSDGQSRPLAPHAGQTRRVSPATSVPRAQRAACGRHVNSHPNAEKRARPRSLTMTG